MVDIEVKYLPNKLRNVFLIIICSLLIIVFLWYLSSIFLKTLELQSREKSYLMGTSVEVIVNGKRSREYAREAMALMQKISNLIDWHDPKSEVSLINDMAGITAVAVSHDTFDVIYRSLRLSRSFSGAFDITIGPLIDIWKQAAKEHLLPKDGVVLVARRLVDYHKVEVDPTAETVKLLDRGMKLDLGGVGKGYVVAKARDLLVKKGVKSAMINAQSSIAVIGLRAPSKKWRIGIQHPRNTSELLGVVTLEPGEALSTSGDYEKYFELGGKKYHHIINPRTGYPAEGCQAVTIIAPDAMIADMLSTAVFVLGWRRGLSLIESLEGVKGLIVTSDGSIIKSRGFILEGVK